ncbi:flavin reductase family protein [Thermodesulfobacterium thermophilum]|uniref:flavin reductase family protein n=1 Tax=Thermodesulfobacterium thermophilum TaxID=886 RepID=UPI0003B38EA4|nr:flavin reductase family protein [Thermodesulfobacterium thermophilum]
MKFYRAFHPRPAVIIGSGNVEQGQANLMACSWITPISVEPPTIGFACATKHYTKELIDKYQAFSVNITENYELIFNVGSVKGREIDKIKKFAIKTKPSPNFKLPLLEESMATFECKVLEGIKVGDHVFYIGEVLFWEAKAFDEEGFKEFWKLPLHKTGRFFVFCDKKVYMVK